MSIVVGYTPDEYGKAALSYGVAEAGLRGEKLIVVNGTRGDSFVDTAFATSEHMVALESQMAELGVEHEVRQVVGADVADGILDVATEVSASLLVIGLRRRSPVGKLFMGSVAQRLILDATCPVFAVKADGAESV
ncbi:MAG: universal stress protein [Nocardioidaceae bacterium]|nr:universal stress protein [Nocardioidaceae bacterium]